MPYYSTTNRAMPTFELHTMKPINPITVVIADDHELFRNGLALLLGSEPYISIKALAGNGRELLEQVKQWKPEVVLTDIRMPILNGVEATREIRQISPATEVIALSMYNDQSLIIDMLQAGAIGYLLKNAEQTEILNAIKAVSQHEHYYSREIGLLLARYIQQKKVPNASDTVFTEREIEVIRYICQEYTTEEIGKKMYLSKRTIDGYRSAIINKMHVKGTAGIVMYAVEHQLFNAKEPV